MTMQPKPSPEPRDLVAELVSLHYAALNGELIVGRIPVGELAERFGTPLYLYDHAVIARQLQALRDALPRQFDVYYSIKANPNQAILRYFVSQACGLEIASGGELVQAISAGCPPDKILFAGPGKTDEEIAAAVAAQIGELHVESLREAERVAAAARNAGRQVRIALRVNPAADVQGGGMRMGAKPAPFGVDEDQLESVIGTLRGEAALDVRGIHLYVGTQILDADVLLAQYRAGVDLARRAADWLGRPLATVDLGGGLGTPYFAHEHRLDLNAVASGLRTLAADIAEDSRVRGARFIVEPGRFLIAEAGIYVARVLDVKTSRGKRYVVVDGGMHQHLAASGNLGQTIKRNFPVAVVNKLNQPVAEPVDVVGPLCTPLDVLARNLPLPRVEIGDLVGIFQSGAYARSASPLGFLSHPSPPEVLIREGKPSLIRRRGNYTDFLADQPRGR